MTTQWDIEHYKNADGTLITYAWPGGYPVVYYDKNYNDLCPDCANRLLAEYNHAREQLLGAYSRAVSDEVFIDLEWYMSMARDTMPRYADIYYEGPTLFCAECNAEIESAYGDPDAEEDNE